MRRFRRKNATALILPHPASGNVGGLMALLESASRLRWPRRIMVSMTSLRNRLAEAPSPGSPLRSRYSKATWKESSRSWESETVMSKKLTRTVRVPCHLRFAGYWPRSNTVPLRDTKLFRTMCGKSAARTA
jgi:hypothetical protein